MLGRKQSVRNNEDWKNALDHIEETVSKKELDSLVKKTVKDIKEKCKGKKAYMPRLCLFLDEEFFEFF